MRKLRCAFGFLTRFPVGSGSRSVPEDLSGSVLFYFAPAFLVGALGAAVYWVVGQLHVAYLGALSYVMAETLATGALHLDGFADVCDAFLCSTSVERRLEIMKDSRLGTFGVTAVAFDIGMKVLLIGALNPTAGTIGALCALPVLGKVALMACAAGGRAARGEGLGHAFLSGMRPVDLALGIAFCCVVASAAAGWRLGSLCCVAALAAGLAMRVVALREIHGVTGDVLGAGNELGEIACLVLMSGAHLAAG